jgi:predicted NBD/HSP70 family sugar kinase
MEPGQAGRDPDDRSVARKFDRSMMRDVNRSLVLDVLRTESPISRTAIARRTSLAKPTVSAIVDVLLKQGMVREAGKGGAAPAGGRRPTMLEFNPSAEAFVGIHFGVTMCSVMVGDGLGQPLATVSNEAAVADPAASFAMAKSMLRDACSKADVPEGRIAGVAAAVPGLIDRASGTCVVAPNLGWYDVPVRQRLEELLGYPTSVHNIAQAAAIAEGRIGVAQGVQSYVWVYVGTGIGSGIIIDGEVFYGVRGFSGEIGHCPVADDGPKCRCGRVGCLETFASGPAIANEAQRLLRSGVSTSLQGVKRPITAQDVAAAAEAGDQIARDVLAHAAEMLGRGVSYLINVLNPNMVVIGGRVAQAGMSLLEPLRASIDRHALDAEEVPVVLSSVALEAEITGALLLAMDHARLGHLLVTARSSP